MSAERFRRCSSCGKDIGFGATYWLCSVSTCNRARLGLFFCSPACWDAHLPEARHREAWAEEKKAPTHAEWLASEEAAGEDASPAPRRVVVTPSGPGSSTSAGHSSSASAGHSSSPSAGRTAATGPASSSAEIPSDVLVVVSKLKAYIRARFGMNTSDGVTDVISDELRRICDLAARHAAADGRKTVLDRDFKAILLD